MAAIQMSVAQIQQSTAAMLGMQGSNKNANEQMALAVEEALKNMGKLATDTYDKLTEGEKVKFVHELVKEMSPEEKSQVQYQIKLDIERNQIAMGSRPKVDSMNDYLANDAYGKDLSRYLKEKGLDKQGNPIYEATGYGYDKYIAGSDQIKLDSNKDSLIVYDSAGKVKVVLNLDGTKNDYLTNQHKEIDMGTLPPLINPIPEPNEFGPNHTGGNQIPEPMPGLEGYPISEQDKNAGIFIHPIPDIIIPSHTGGDQIIEKDWRDYVLTADNRLPIPEKITAGNGLDIESNTKHTPGAPGFRPNAGIEPKNSLDLFEESVPTDDPKVRLAIDEDGNIHRFSNSSKDGTGSYHWSGSTGDKNALGHNELRKFNDIIKRLKAK